MGYLDPGLFGVLSQIGVVVLLFVVTIFTFFSKKVKKLFGKIFKTKNDDTDNDKV